jgi:amino acid transporter
MTQPIPQIIIPLIITLPLIAFWVWMFQDMVNNDNLPSDTKNTWALAFLIANVFAATFYYATQIERVENARDAAKRSARRRTLAILIGVPLLMLIITIIRYLHQ